MGILEILKGEQPGPIRMIMNYENTGQFGEYATEFALTNNNLKGKLKVLRNIYVPNKDKTTEIDLLMIHEKGIFVFESKNYSGWIFGSIDQQNWTQSLPSKKKHSFFNPVIQNQVHIKALASYLNKPIDTFHSYIVFSERCELKRVPENTDTVTIVRRPKMLSHLRKQLEQRSVVFSEDQMNELINALVPLTNKSEIEKLEHINNVKAVQTGTICPFCRSPLIKRASKNGEFWGCSNYPRCKYTKRIAKK